MAFKADKSTLKQRDELVALLNEKRAELDAALEAYNSQIAPLSADLRAAVDEYNSLLFDVQAFIQDFVNEMQSEFEDKSERWQEGDRGQSVGEWISEMESSSDFEEIELEGPQEIQIDVDDHATLLEELQLEPELI